MTPWASPCLAYRTRWIKLIACESGASESDRFQSLIRVYFQAKHCPDCTPEDQTVIDYSTMNWNHLIWSCKLCLCIHAAEFSRGLKPLNMELRLSMGAAKKPVSWKIFCSDTCSLVTKSLKSFANIRKSDQQVVFDAEGVCWVTNWLTLRGESLITNYVFLQPIQRKIKSRKKSISHRWRARFIGLQLWRYLFAISEQKYSLFGINFANSVKHNMSHFRECKFHSYRKADIRDLATCH